MNSKDKKVKEALVKARKAIRSKYKLLKRGINMEQLALEKTFKPISEPLKELSEKVTDNVNLKKELFQDFKNEDIKTSSQIPAEEFNEDSFTAFKAPLTKKYPPQVQKILNEYSKPKEISSLSKQSPQFLPSDVIAELDTSVLPDDEGEKINPNLSLSDIINQSNIQPQVLENYLEQFAPLPRQYIEFLTRDVDKKADYSQFGIKHDPTLEKWSIGNAEINFKDNDIIIKNKTFTGTQGLYELLFKKDPIKYTNKDLKAYKTILELTNAHKRGFDRNNQIAGNKSKKYLKIIQPLFITSTPRKRVGFGNIKQKIDQIYKRATDQPKEYIYWNKPKELIQRLKLLVASKEAGNTGVDNEIISIIEELKEEGIII